MHRINKHKHQQQRLSHFWMRQVRKAFSEFPSSARRKYLGLTTRKKLKKRNTQTITHHALLLHLSTNGYGWLLPLALMNAAAKDTDKHACAEVSTVTVFTGLRGPYLAHWGHEGKCLNLRVLYSFSWSCPPHSPCFKPVNTQPLPQQAESHHPMTPPSGHLTPHLQVPLSSQDIMAAMQKPYSLQV